MLIYLDKILQEWHMAGGARVTQGVRFGDRQGGRGEQMWQSYPGRSSGQTEAGFFFLIFICLCWVLSCSMWDLVPWPKTKPRPPVVGAWSLSWWTTREVPKIFFKIFNFSLSFDSHLLKFSRVCVCVSVCVCLYIYISIHKFIY